LESGGRNIPNTTQGTSSGQAQGYDQITTGTWREFAPAAGIDLNKYPTALSAPKQLQRQVASNIPLERWDPKTLNGLKAAGFSVQPNLTLGQNIAQNGGAPAPAGGIDILSGSPTDYSAPVADAARNAAIGAAAAAIAPKRDILAAPPTDYSATAAAPAAPTTQGITVETPVGSASGQANFTVSPSGPAPTSTSINPPGKSAPQSIMSAPGGGLEVMNSLPVVGPGILKAGAAANALVSPYIGSGQPRTLSDLITGNNPGTSGDTFSQRYAGERALQEQQMKTFETQHPIASTAANVAGGVLGTAPLIAAAPAAFGMGTGLGAIPNALIAGTTNAGLGALDTGVRGGSASDVERSAAIGAAGGAGGALLGSGLNAVGRTIGGGVLPDDIANLAAVARDKYGINLTADQLGTDTGSKFVRSASDSLPFSGAGSDIANTQAQFNAAVSRTMGENATKLTPDVMNAAKARIGSYYDQVAASTNLNVDSQFMQDLHDTLNNASQVLPKSEAEPLVKQAQSILEKIDPTTKTISGATYQALTNTGAPLDRLIESENPNISFFANGLKKTLDGALARSASPADQAMLQTADKQWASMRTVQQVVTKSPTGDVSPALLAGRVNAATGNGMAFGYGGDLGELARIGQTFMKPPQSSGTAERLASLGGLGAVASGGNALLTGGSLMGAAHGLLAVPAVLAANRYAINPLLRSRGMANALINRSLPSGVSSGPATMPAIGALTAGAGNALLQPAGQ
jgi:hypothetical protein